MKTRKSKQNKTTLVQLSFTTLGQETRLAYSKMLPCLHRALGKRIRPIPQFLQPAWGCTLL